MLCAVFNVIPEDIASTHHWGLQNCLLCLYSATIVIAETWHQGQTRDAWISSDSPSLHDTSTSLNPGSPRYGGHFFEDLVRTFGDHVVSQVKKTAPSYPSGHQLP